MANVKLKDLAPGTVFDAGPIDVRVLEHLESGITLLIADTSIADRHFADQPFKLRPEKPTPFPNDWRFSNLRDELNGEFLESFDNAEGPVRSAYIVTADWNLKDHEGGEGYGIIQDKVCLLTEEQFKKYSAEGLLDLDDWWWLATPYAGGSYHAHLVSTGGGLVGDHAYGGYHGVRPAFYVESEIVISQEPDQVDISDPSLLKNFTVREIVEELFRRIGSQERIAENDEDDDF